MVLAPLINMWSIALNARVKPAFRKFFCLLAKICLYWRGAKRRAGHNESDALVGRKAAAASAARIRPIICVGETLSERESGATVAVVRRQLRAAISKLSLAQLTQVVVAYEPAWAIGTGRTATPEMAQEVHAETLYSLALYARLRFRQLVA